MSIADLLLVAREEQKLAGGNPEESAGMVSLCETNFFKKHLTLMESRVNCPKLLDKKYLL